ncbi:hypothetical protein L1987_30046 [Smallanthus sonchifolius]|uniref:Uncharacterized protein n=1 Tax=Smallanthus sonchifolius TaxID=185202 RepID=A0ACB9I2J3_9ASTR|nr:hypothetical protein L1987_30046 [Smallanthus sonchifolius]
MITLEALNDLLECSGSLPLVAVKNRHSVWMMIPLAVLSSSGGSEISGFAAGKWFVLPSSPAVGNSAQKA